MRILILDTVYDGYVQWLYGSDPDLLNKPYADQHEATIKGGFHTAAVWAEPLRQLGHNVIDIWGNHAPLQIRWCQENSHEEILRMNANSFQIAGMTLSSSNPNPWYESIIEKQIEAYCPDIIWIANVNTFATPFLEKVKTLYRMAIGEITSAIPNVDLSGFDFMISGAMSLVEELRSKEITAELLLHGFRDNILGELSPANKEHGLVFVGQLFDGRVELIEALGRNVGIEVWANSPWKEDQLSSMGIEAHPPVFGVPMYQILRNSKIILNKHIHAVKNFASNQRLFEVTGVGSMILTDAAINLEELFKPGEEIVAYRNIDVCVTLAKQYLNDDKKRESIAKAGCRRTLRDHTVSQRALDIKVIIDQHCSPILP